MVTLPVRPLKAPGVALAAAAGALTLAPVVAMPVVAPPSVQVGVDDIALAGIGQDIYEAITPWVQEGVAGASYLINFIPLVGGITAAQININYFQGIQPAVEATVDYLAAVVQDPFDFFPATAAYGDVLFDIGSNWVSAQLMFIGLEPLSQGPVAQPYSGAVTRAAAAVAASAVEIPEELSTDVRPAISDTAVTRSSKSLRGGRIAKPSRVARPAAATFGAAYIEAAPQRSAKAAASRATR